MKKVISIFTLAFFSTTLFAARLPTENEGVDIVKKIINNTSVSDIISIVKNDKLDLVSEFINIYSNGNMKKVSGRSYFAGTIISKRLNTANPVGSLQENLYLLDLIIGKGVNLNIKQSGEGYGGVDFWNGDASLATMAADACSLETIKLLEKKGADLGAETFNWARAFNKATLLSAPLDQKCKDVAEYLISKSNQSDVSTIRSFLYSNTSNNNFLNGVDIDQSLSENLREEISNRLNIKFSKHPDGETPSEEWYQDFAERFKTPFSLENDWFSSQNDNHKAWACYLSTIDESVVGFNSIGLSNEWLTSNPIGDPFAFFAVFSKTMVYDFTNYCNSIK
jgi:hypothetical protein